MSDFLDLLPVVVVPGLVGYLLGDHFFGVFGYIGLPLAVFFGVFVGMYWGSR